MSSFSSNQEESSCYFCGADADTREHVPPKSLLNEGGKRITVPSCATHNTARSSDDEYLRLVISGKAWNSAPPEVRDKLLRSVVRGRGPGPRVLGMTYGHTPQGASYDVDLERVGGCFEAIARAIIFKRFNERAPIGTRPQVFYDFIDCGLDAPLHLLARHRLVQHMALRLLDEIPFEGDEPQVFKFKAQRSCVHICLYSSCNVIVSFL